MSAITINSIEKSLRKSYKQCKRHKSVLPKFRPLISTISRNSSVAGQYTIVYISGTDFFGFGLTSVNFGSYTNIPIVYYSSFNISFVVPPSASKGNYNIRVVNIYNGQLGASANYSYPGQLKLSDPIQYTLT